jgi:hypothetical protein
MDLDRAHNLVWSILINLVINITYPLLEPSHKTVSLKREIQDLVRLEYKIHKIQET